MSKPLKFGGGDIVRLLVDDKYVEGEIAGMALKGEDTYKWLVHVSGIDSPIQRESNELTLIKAFEDTNE